MSAQPSRKPRENNMPRPLKPSDLRHILQLIVVNYGQTVLDVSQKTKGAITGILAAEWPNDHDRRIAINYLFSEPGTPVKEMSTKRLSDAQWTALKRWIGASREDETMAWENSPWFAEEAKWLLWEVAKLERAESAYIENM